MYKAVTNVTSGISNMLWGSTPTKSKAKAKPKRRTESKSNSNSKSVSTVSSESSPSVHTKLKFARLCDGVVILKMHKEQIEHIRPYLVKPAVKKISSNMIKLIRKIIKLTVKTNLTNTEKKEKSILMKRYNNNVKKLNKAIIKK